MQAKNLEELELQQPFFERTLRPLGRPAVRRGRADHLESFTERTEKRLALAGNPGDMRVADWLGIKAIGAVVGADPVLPPVRASSGPRLPVHRGS